MATKASDARVTLAAGAANPGLGEHRMPAVLLRGRHDKDKCRRAENQQA
jgi:hypothetical protein